MIPEGDVSGSFRDELLTALPNLRAFAVSVAGHRPDIDDLVQTTIMKAWANKHSFTPGTNMRAGLVTILRNEYYSILRKRKREVEDADGEYEASLTTNPAQQGNVDLKDFQKALAKLTPEQREAIVLVGASGFAYEEAAEICGCAVGTIKSRVNRARTRLQELMNVSGPEDFGPDAT